MPELNPWLGLLILLTLQALWFALARSIGTSMKPENSRKLYHAGNGTLMFLLPPLVPALLPVLLWAALNLAAPIAVNSMPAMKKRLTGNMYKVGRVSYGDVCFVLGVTLLYWLSIGNYFLYAVPLTMLSYADAVSAVVGKRFGRHKYDATEGRKSIEGSLAFFAVAFAGTLGWSFIQPAPIWWQSLLIALILGFLVMLVEAIAWSGLDNLLIPLGGFVLLTTFLKMDLAELLIDLVFAIGIVGFTLLWRRRTTLRDSALLTAALFGYIVWSVPSALFGYAPYSAQAWVWLAVPLLLFVAYNVVFAPVLVEEEHESHNVDAVFSAALPGLLWLAAAFHFVRPDFVFPYSAAFAAVALNMFTEQRHSHVLPRGRLAEVVVSALLMLLLGALLATLDGEGLGPRWAAAGMLVAWGLGAVLVGVLIGEVLHRRIRESRWRWHVRAALCIFVSLLAALPLFM